MENKRTKVVALVANTGSGGTMLARAFYERHVPDELDLTPACKDELAMIRAHVSESFQLVRPQFRAPHHTASEAALVGTSKQQRDGSTRVYAGEVSLAHGGVLLLDDLCEFRASTLERTARVLAGGVCRLSQGLDKLPVLLPAAPVLVVAIVRPCACNRHPTCTCTLERRKRYHDRVRPFFTILDTPLPGDER